LTITESTMLTGVGSKVLQDDVLGTKTLESFGGGFCGMSHNGRSFVVCFIFLYLFGRIPTVETHRDMC